MRAKRERERYEEINTRIKVKRVRRSDKEAGQRGGEERKRDERRERKRVKERKMEGEIDRYW